MILRPSTEADRSSEVEKASQASDTGNGTPYGIAASGTQSVDEWRARSSRNADANADPGSRSRTGGEHRQLMVSESETQFPLAGS